MKTQISRDSFAPEQRYSGVYLQQGRMILDADWNELTDIQKERLVTALRDAISGTGGGFGSGQTTIAGGAPRIGGLAVYADPAGSATIRIRPGALYVEGVSARLNPGPPLAINAQPDYPIQADYTGQGLRLYADVWERSVSALEQTALMDAALHGADTATRSQTMLQVKWCGFDPLDKAKNPPIGDAPLTLTLRLIASSGDACDPCASQVKVNERLGNYLFRVEVHDYDPTPGARKLTLKWSRDNGAEACAANAMPQGFNQGDWIWEFFDNDTERLLGNHFAANARKLRGYLTKTCTAPLAADQPKTYVRQWDGYLIINLDSHAVLGGADRGIDLFAGPAADQSPGRVFCDATILKINLELMEFQMTVAAKTFVPGDYWLAEVREAEDESGDVVLANALPRGVRHHYLFLGELAANGRLVAQDDAFDRRMNFPPLTDLRAADVGFANACSKLYADAANVQDALDELCKIDAGDIAYTLPNCAGNEGKSIKDRLKNTLDPDADGKLTVQAALDNLLCLLNAASLPYAVPGCAASPSVRSLLGLAAGDNNVGPVLDRLLCDFKADDLPIDKSDPALCPDLKTANEVVTVQDALNYLCEKRPSCVISVAVGELERLLQDFADSAGQHDLWLCLQPGEHVIGKPLTIQGKNSLRLSALAAGAATVHFTAGPALFEAEELGLEGVYCLFAASARLELRADRIVANRCSFARSSADPHLPPMVLLEGWHDAGELTWRDNLMSDTWKKAAAATGGLVAVDTVGDIKVAEAFADLLGNKVYPENPPLFDKKIGEISNMIAAMPAAAKESWLASVQAATRSAPTRGRAAAKGAKATRTARAPSRDIGVAAASFAVGTPTMETAQPKFAAALTRIVEAGADATAVAAFLGETIGELLFDTGYGVALALADNKLSGSVDDNRIDGELELKNGLATNGGDPRGQTLTNNTHPGITAAGSLSLAGNRIQRLWARMPTGCIDHGSWTMRVPGYQSLALTGNQLSDYGHSAVAALLTVTGNRILNGNPTGITAIGKLFTANAALSGNSASFADEFTQLLVAGNLVETAANVMVVHKL